MQIFPRSLNKLPMILGGVGTVVPALLVGAIWYYATPKNFQVGYAPEQPVPYSHRLHAGQMGMDCRYCHANVEVAAKAMIPATQTCMGCHAMVKTESAKLAPVRESWETGKPIEWVHIHKLPDHAYFDHSAHLSAGVGCASCHGRVDQMDVVRQVQPLSMGWCLECHRDPAQHIRPVSEITNMAWAGPPAQPPRPLHPPQTCSGCHR